jgi:Icc-related predicted phosphoesterase
MKVLIISDIHLEFEARELDFSGCDLIVMAGDIHVGEKGVRWLIEKTNEIPVIYVLGNHEYYKNTYPKLLDNIRKIAQGTNIFVLENDTVNMSGVCFHGATLWTDFELFGNPRIAGYECQQRMNDYKYIRRYPSYSRMRSIDTYHIHKESLNWLSKSLKNSKATTNVVVTHHAPSIQSVNEKYRNETISTAFVSDLDNFIQEMKPQWWIHGHIHEAFDYSIGQTRVICNPMGYPGEDGNGYTDKLILEIS